MKEFKYLGVSVSEQRAIKLDPWAIPPSTSRLALGAKCVMDGASPKASLVILCVVSMGNMYVRGRNCCHSPAVLETATDLVAEWQMAYGMWGSLWHWGLGWPSHKQLLYQVAHTTQPSLPSSHTREGCMPCLPGSFHTLVPFPPQQITRALYVR